jgi:hypothetical protein
MSCRLPTASQVYTASTSRALSLRHDAASFSAPSQINLLFAIHHEAAAVFGGFGEAC